MITLLLTFALAEDTLEICNDVEGYIAESSASTWFKDSDGDGIGTPDVWVFSCVAPDGYVPDGVDCNDADATIYKGAAEVCNGVDDNCDDVIDDDAVDSITLYMDEDGDGYGNSLLSVTDCTVILGYVENLEDCNDTDGAISPDTAEVCFNNIDDNCDEIGCELSGTIEITSAHAKLMGVSRYDQAGYVVAGMGDTNADGYDDILIGARDADAGSMVDSGAAYVVFGPVTGSVSLSTANAVLWGESAGAYLGYFVSTAGDYNGDGYMDALMGAPRYNSSTGAAYVVFGPIAQNLSMADADVRLLGTSANDELGTVVAGGGDVDNDGFDDVVIGAPGVEQTRHRGAAYILHGPVDGTLSSATWIRGFFNDNIGGSVDILPDTNGDGYDDVLIGAPRSHIGLDGIGLTFLFFGPLQGTVSSSDPDAVLQSETIQEGTGYTVSSAGDVNGDGYTDILTADYQNDTTGIDAGVVYLVSSPVQGTFLLSNATAKFTGEAAGDGAGFAISDVQDTNTDAYDDLLIGARYHDAAATDDGAAYLILGPASGTINLSVADARLTGENAYDMLGRSVAGAGDVNGDGRYDLLIASYTNDESFENAGATYLLYAGGF